jgi:hypothetical protein
MNSKLLALEAKKRLHVERERERESTRKQQIGRERERDSARELRREREREEQMRSQDLKLAGVTWPH